MAEDKALSASSSNMDVGTLALSSLLTKVNPATYSLMGGSGTFFASYKSKPCHLQSYGRVRHFFFSSYKGKPCHLQSYGRVRHILLFL